MAEGIAVPGRWIHGNSCWLLRQGKLTEFSYARSYIYRGTRKGLYMYGRRAITSYRWTPMRTPSVTLGLSVRCSKKCCVYCTIGTLHEKPR
ncbi:unnamed protein product [Plutella xylostella]|uniref:(diamondback moth) hypothetical protein n=1 Tax=Plutella xylostella TaxID=51655 RepID=A0A8S4GCM9_PLUXY|nr:unnamed protein product [Plutella xylostella]